MTLQKSRNFGRKSDLTVKLDLPEHFDRMCQSVWKNHFDMFGDLQQYASALDVSESACKSYFYGNTEPRLSTGFAILQIISALSEAQIQAARDRQAAVRGITRYVG